MTKSPIPAKSPATMVGAPVVVDDDKDRSIFSGITVIVVVVETLESPVISWRMHYPID